MFPLKRRYCCSWCVCERGMGSQMKRSVVTSRAESSGQQQMPGAAGTQKLCTNDALAYLKSVKDAFEDKKEIYDEFLEVMKDFKSQRTDTMRVIARVKQLFKGHRELILGFNAFLPKGYEITLTNEGDQQPQKKPVEFEEAFSFVNKIKIRFEGEDCVYKSFLDILNMYRKGNKSISEVYREVALLFQDHPDLLIEFTHFLPEHSTTASIHHGSSGRKSILRDSGSEIPVIHQNHVDKNDRITTLHPECAPSVDRHEHDQPRVNIQADKEQGKHGDKQGERTEQEQDDRDFKHDGITEYNMQGTFHKHEFGSRMGDSAGKHLQQSADEDVGTRLTSSSCSDQTALKSIYPHELSFSEKVKEKLEPNHQQEFVKCLNIFDKNIITRSELQSLGSTQCLFFMWRDRAIYERVRDVIIEVKDEKFGLQEPVKFLQYKLKREGNINGWKPMSVVFLWIASVMLVILFVTLCVV